MSARRPATLALVIAIAYALVAIACDANEPGAGGPEPGSSAIATAAVVSAAAATTASAAATDPAEQAAHDEQARADLAADVRRRIEHAHETFGESVPLRIESGLFVFVAAERGVPFDAAADFAQRAIDAYFGSFFARRPDRAVTVELVRSASAFSQRCDARFPSGCEGDLGAYSRKTRDIIVNVGPGLPTISHELIHPLVQTDFPRIIEWFDEGIASLFEKPVFGPAAGEMHGANNWRYARLSRALRSPNERDEVHLPKLFALYQLTYDTVDQDLHYAEARALCQWLDERGQLWPFYRAWRDGVAEDSSGEKSFALITGTTPAEADATWLAWAKTLR
jgi:hypothetical protein